MPTGRFQSHFFSFFSQQSLRLRDRTSQAWRQVKMTAVWGTQILLYPIYAAFQTTRLVSRQMGQAVRQMLPQLQAAKQTSQLSKPAAQDAPLVLTSDTPIQNTLQAIDEVLQSLPAAAIVAQLNSSEASANGAIEHRPAATPLFVDLNSSDLAVQRLRVHGVASLINTRSLVLVTIENHILDILTPQQQHHLQQRMVSELVSYHQQRRSLHASRLTNFLPLPSHRPNAFFPIRVFYRLMTWMQTSSIAIATNLFQESQLALLHAAETEAIAQLPASKHSLRSTDQPWLTWENLFNRQSAQPSASEWDMFNPVPESKLVKRKPSAVTRSDRHTRQKTKQAGNLVAPSPEDALTPTVFTSQETSLATSAAQSAENGISATWIDVEAEVKLVTYVKHPLEQLLDWLDRGMVWIEEKLAHTLHWLRDRLP